MARNVNKARLMPEDWELIILNYAFGKSTEDIAQIVGVTDKNIQRVIRTFETVKSKDWEKVAELVRINNVSVSFIQWAAEKTGDKVPEETMAKIELYRNQFNEAAKQIAATQKKAGGSDLQQKSIGDNEKIFIAEVLKNLRANTEYWETFMDVVMPKYANDLKDNFNVNFDLLSQRIANIEKNIETIAHNTRKRGM